MQFTEWAKDDAQLFREALASGVRDLAGTIGNEIFGVGSSDNARDILDF